MSKWIDRLKNGAGSTALQHMDSVFAEQRARIIEQREAIYRLEDRIAAATSYLVGMGLPNDLVEKVLQLGPRQAMDMGELHRAELVREGDHHGQARCPGTVDALDPQEGLQLEDADT